MHVTIPIYLNIHMLAMCKKISPRMAKEQCVIIKIDKSHGEDILFNLSYFTLLIYIFFFILNYPSISNKKAKLYG